MHSVRHFRSGGRANARKVQKRTMDKKGKQAMLSSVLNSKTAIQINMGIMRAFVAVRQMVALPKTDKLTELQNEVKELKDYIEEVFADYNDINDDTRMQLELINQTLAELQAKKKLEEKPRRRIGFIQHGE